MTRRFWIWEVAIFIVIALLALASFAFGYSKEHFVGNVFIEGINCNGLTVQEAKNKIDTDISNRKRMINFIFANGSEMHVTNSIVGKNVKISKIREIFIRSQGKWTFGDSKLEYSLNSSDYEIDEEILRSYLAKEPNLWEENMQEMQNAYLTIGDDGFIQIVPEVIGTKIEFEKAYDFALETLKKGGNTVNFKLEAISEPEIKSNDINLIDKRDRINNILKSKIILNLKDGSTYTIDYNVSKRWILTENGSDIFTSKEKDITNCKIGLEAGIEKCLEELQAKIQSGGEYVDFITTSGETVHLAVDKSHIDKLDVEAESEKLLEEIQSGMTITRDVTYAHKVTFDEYVEIDIDNQTVYMYKNGNCIVQTPCVTGSIAAGHETPPGIFYLTFKEKDRYLQGTNNDGSKYKSYVNYWMPFNGGIGLHDATWRASFGGSIYKTSGSHGCVNLPKDAAEVIYENITYDMPIVVH